MKQYMNKFLTIVALLMLTCLGARAEQTVTIVVNPSDGGTVTYGITGGTGGAGGVCTLTATPASGYYLTVENLTAKTTLNGTGMQGRTRTDIEVSNETLVITATNASADPSGETTYTFNMPTDQNINVEVTAEFKALEAITPTVTLAGWTYGDNPNVPQVGGNPGNGAVTFTYKAEGATEFTGDMPTNAGTHTVKAAVDAANKYAAGEATNTFTINKAAGTISYATASVNKTYGDAAFTNELTKTGDGTVSYESTNIDAATVDEQTGEVTIVGDGEATITATVKDGTNYTYATKTASYLVSVGTAAMEVTAENVTATYDGQPHSITVNAPDDATITYSKDGKTYDDKLPTYTDAGTYTVFYKVTKDNFSDVTGSAIVTINKAASMVTKAPEAIDGLTYTGQAQTLITAGEATGGTLMYSTDGTTYDTTLPTATEVNTYTIYYKVEGDANHNDTEAKTITVTISKPKAEVYNLWIGDTQVTRENANDVFKDGEYDETGKLTSAGSYTFNPENNYLFITDNQRSVDANDPNAEEVLLTITSELRNLTIFINGETPSKLKSIVSSADGSTLKFTGEGNEACSLTIENDEGQSAISGFETLDFESQWGIKFLEPEGVEYGYNSYLKTICLYHSSPETGQDVIANTVTIGKPMNSLDKTVPMNLENLQQTDADGNPVYDDNNNPVMKDLRNAVIDGRVLVTAQQSNNPESDEGHDDSDGISGVAFEGTMTDAAVKTVAAAVNNNEMTPGGQTFAENFNGVTVQLPRGEGTIEVQVVTEPGYSWHLSINGDDSFNLINLETGALTHAEIANWKKEGDIVCVWIHYTADEPSYCYLYLVKDDAGARPVKPIGKRDKAHGKIVTVGVKVVKSAGRNSPSEASGGVIPEETDIVTGITDNSIIDNHIRVDNDRWYNLNGQQVDKPTKQGLYIHKGKKIYIK